MALLFSIPAYSNDKLVFHVGWHSDKASVALGAAHALAQNGKCFSAAWTKDDILFGANITLLVIAGSYITYKGLEWLLSGDKKQEEKHGN